MASRRTRRGLEQRSPASRRSEAAVRTRRFAAISVLVLSSSQSLAQEQSRDRPKYGSVHLGPFYLSLRVPFAAGVDSNVYNTPDGTSDESASVTPSLQAVLPLTRHARIRGTGGIVPQYFHREATERYTDRFGDVRGEVDVGPITAYGGRWGGPAPPRYCSVLRPPGWRYDKERHL